MTEVRSFLSDDADIDDREYELRVFMGDNGDWYVQVMPRGHKIGPTVRVRTSGGASSTHPGLPGAVAELYRALEPQTIAEYLAPRCPSGCRFCTGEACDKCGAGIDEGALRGDDQQSCGHDAVERHEYGFWRR